MMRPNPFAAVRGRKVRVRSARRKAELQAQHDAGPDEYLGDTDGRLPRGHKVPEELSQHENFMPPIVRRQGLRANTLVRKERRRPHRPTGERKGPQVDDSPLARDYHHLINTYGMKPHAAKRRLAEVLVYGTYGMEPSAAPGDAEKAVLKSALARIRRAIAKLGYD